MKTLRTLSCTALALSTACATNPARPDLVENSEEMRVDGSELYRGQERLDEQEFYTLVGATDDAEKIKSQRSLGELEQTAGIAIIAVGATVGLGLLGYVYAAGQGLAPKFGDDASASSVYPLYGALAAGAVALGGGAVYGWGVANVTGRVFDPPHAQAALERSLYGEGGASPQTIASLALGTTDGVAHVCSVSGAALNPIVAMDAKGRKLKLEDRANWFGYTSEPKGLLATESQQGTPSSIGIASPIATDLSQLDAPITITAVVLGTGVKQEIALKLDLGCPAALDFGAGGGSSGQSGAWGSSGSGGGNGGNGGDGGIGGDGERGPDVEAEVAFVTTPKFGKALLVAARRKGDANTYLALVDPASLSGRTIDVGAYGGYGGSGGNGGSGGSGSGFSGSECRQGGSGGSGGRGGVGGRGGDGGNIVVRASDEEANKFLQANVGGGAGGGRGSGGSGGSGGSSDSCGDQSLPRGADGARGPDGSQGPDGQPGRVDRSVVGNGGLKLIPKVLATNQQVKLAGAGSAPAAPPPESAKKSKKGKK